MSPVPPKLHTVTLTLDLPPSSGGGGRHWTAAGSASPKPRPPHKQPASAARQPPSLQPQVPGCMHCDCQTEPAILEALEFSMETSCSTQTDAALPPLPPPRVVTVPTVSEAGTQVCPADLFDWEQVAVPAIEQLVGQVLQQAQAEVAEEWRMEVLSRTQQELEEVQYQERQELLRQAAEQAQLQREAAERAAFQLVPLEGLERKVHEMALPMLEGLAVAHLLQAAGSGSGGEHEAEQVVEDVTPAQPADSQESIGEGVAGAGPREEAAPEGSGKVLASSAEDGQDSSSGGD